MRITVSAAGWLAAALTVAAISPGAYAQSTPPAATGRVIQIDPENRAGLPAVASALALGPGGQILAAAGDDHQVRVFDLAEGELLMRLSGPTDWIRAIAVRPDRKVLAAAGNDRRIRLWQLDSGQPAGVWSDHTAAITTLAYRPDGQSLAAGGFDGTVRLHDANSGQVVRELALPGGDVRTLVFSPCGEQIAAAGRSGAIRIWSVDTGQLLAEFHDPARRIHDVAFSPDGTRLASGGDGPSIRVWNVVGQPDPIKELPARPGGIRALAFCGPDTLAAGSTDNSVRVWDLTSGQMQSRLDGHTGTVADLVFGPQGSLYSAAFDTTIRSWRLGPTAGDDQQEISRRDGGLSPSR